ncbi:unnamed protein product [Polarella glacialis]|uniref:50S ribosomal protein L20 n=2 Tax=Polarella glacialis TaxID=89957 RepID=A0A813JZ78_POLGL|nr:unnamed protein product [Polarella glacialis]
MLSQVAFTAARWSPIAPEVSPGLRAAARHGVEAVPLSSLPSLASSSGSSSGWSLAAAGALVAAAAMRTAGRRRRSAPNGFGVHKDVVLVSHGPAILSGVQGSMAATPLTFAARGQAEANRTGRASRIVTNVRIRKGPYTVWKRKDMWLSLSTTFSNRSKNCFRIAKQAVMHALKKKYKSRRLFKRDRRSLWIMRVGASSRLHGIPYCELISHMKVANININRKIMSQLGAYDRAVFTNIMEVAVPNWKQIKAKKDYRRPDYTVEELDAVGIPYLEQIAPEIYTDATIRFNRQVRSWGVEYTIDMGPPEEWRDLLPKMPELANFNIPDNFIGNSNAEFEDAPLEMLITPDRLQPASYWKFKEKVALTQAEDAEKEARGEVTWPKKTGVSREDWFKREPQSWF